MRLSFKITQIHYEKVEWMNFVNQFIPTVLSKKFQNNLPLKLDLNDDTVDTTYEYVLSR